MARPPSPVKVAPAAVAAAADGGEPPFVKAPGFAEADERKARLFNPITRRTLDTKCAALLPAEIVAGRTVADLGACLGAMCHWSLSFGAARALAVETQPDFCRRAEALLAPWGERAAVVNQVMPTVPL